MTRRHCRFSKSSISTRLFCIHRSRGVRRAKRSSRLRRQLNIGIDSLLFVDDSEFELQQVKTACPGVRVLNARKYLSIPEMQECQVPITAESMNRRKMYQVERIRQEGAQTFGSDYKSFLQIAI